MKASKAEMAQILLINPNTSRQTTELMARQARACLPAGMLLLTATAQRGDGGIREFAASWRWAHCNAIMPASPQCCRAAPEPAID